MEKKVLTGLLVLCFLTGCATFPQKKRMSSKEEKSLEVEVKQTLAIAETSLEISKDAEKFAKDSLEKSRQANATSEKALESANKAIAAANDAKTFAAEETQKAINAANEASEKAITAANKAAKMAMEYADKSSEKSVNAANEAIKQSNEASEKAIKASDRATAVANQTISEINRVRATIRMAPPEEPILQEEPLIKNIYKVKSGDTLTKIAMKFYKNSSKWKLIYEHNKDKIKNPNLLNPGLELIIP